MALKRAAKNAVTLVKKVTYLLKFRNLNSPCMRISTHIGVYEPSEDDYRLLIANSMTPASGRHICAPQRDTNMASHT